MIYTDINDLHYVKDAWARLTNNRMVYYTIKLANNKNLSTFISTYLNDGIITSLWAGWSVVSKFDNTGLFLFTPAYKQIIFKNDAVIGDVSQDSTGELMSEIVNEMKVKKVCSLSFIGVDDDFISGMRETLSKDNFAFHTFMTNRRPHYYLDFDDPNSLKKVKKLHRRSRTPDKFNHASVDIKVYDKELEEFYGIARKISCVSLKSQTGTPFREGKEWLEKYDLLSKENKLMCFVLSIDDTDVAYLIVRIENNVAYFDQANYTYKYVYECPGIYLLIKAIEYLNEKKNITYFDLDVGENTFKRRIASEVTYCEDLHLYRKTIKGTALFIIITTVNKVISMRNSMAPFIRPLHYFRNIQKYLLSKKLANICLPESPSVVSISDNRR